MCWLFFMYSPTHFLNLNDYLLFFHYGNYAYYTNCELHSATIPSISLSHQTFFFFLLSGCEMNKQKKGSRINYWWLWQYATMRLWMSVWFLSSLRSRRRYHRAQRDSICLSVCRLSVIKLLPAYGTDHYQNAHTGSSGHCEGQSRFDIDRSPIPRPPTTPKNDPQNENFYFLTYWLEILYITSWPLPHHNSWHESQLQDAQLRMSRSVFFSFASIDLKFCR